MSEKTVEEETAEIEKIRADRAAQTDKLRKAQRLIDMRALVELECQHGDTNIDKVPVPFVPGLPTMVIVRTANKAELSKYRHEAKPKKQDDAITSRMADAGEVIADLENGPMIYPDRATFVKICEARPGVKASVGGAAVRLATSHEQDEGKD